MASNLPVGIDTVNEVAYRGGHSLLQVKERIEHGMAFIPNSTLSVDLARLREDGFQLDTLTSEVFAVILPNPRCSSLEESKVIDKLTFVVRLNGKVYYKMVASKLGSDLVIPIQVDVQTVDLSTVAPASVTDYSAKDCLRGVWANVHLSRHPSLFPVCRPQCLEAARGGHALLSCFIEGCESQRIRLDTNSGYAQSFLDMKSSTAGTIIGIDSLPAKGHPLINFGRGKGGREDRFWSGIAVRGSKRLTFDIQKIRRHLKSFGQQFDVFVSRAGLVQLDRTSCRVSNSQSLKSRKGQGMLFATFSVYVDGELRAKTLIDMKNRSIAADTIVVPLPWQARTLTLEVNYSSTTARRCTRAVWAGAELRPAKRLHWTKCQELCEERAARGSVYLSCLIGVCTGKLAVQSNPPVFYLQRADRGIGMDTSGTQNQQPLWLAHTNTPLKRGLAAQAPSRILFDLDALRLAHVSFTTFSVQPGINRYSRCRRMPSSGEFRIYLDGQLAYTQRFAHARQDSAREVHLPVGSVHHLQLVTRNIFRLSPPCALTVWGDARLWSLLPV